ncbi:MAG: pyridoxal-phosphate dependent enzyme [Anaerolineae bacterium]|nr:pyridoxal-phosphate dependent enzyme [Anaerolineae bacterium]
MKTLFNSVRCLVCGYEMIADLYAARCERCGNPWLDARYDLAALPADWPGIVARRPLNLWRYAELLPFPEGFTFVSMGEGWTPLTRAAGLERETGYGKQGGEIWIKDERQNPTGSLKDRQAAFTISALKARGITEMVLASTGNAAAGYAAYCARAGIKLWVFLPSSVPAEKMRELALYGAEVIKVTGTYDQAKEIAAEFAARRGIYLDGGAKAIPGKESMKTIAFEIAEQFGWQAPDWYIQAVSGGIGPLGVMKGFIELHEAGLIERVPKLGIVQVTGCAPMVRAWERGLAQAEPVQPDTLVTVLATGKPGLAYDILKQMTDQYGGAMIAVSDGEAFRAMRRMARTEGFSMEPAASVAFAGLEKLLVAGHILPGERVLVNCSGHTFSAEKHALEDRYVFQLQIEAPFQAQRTPEGLAVTLEQLDEQITTIVIIDDNPNDSRLLRRLLQTYKQYRIFEAHNAADGLDLVRQRRPDLIMLDLSMPETDGFAVLEALKADERTREIPVVIVSAKTLTPDEWTYLRHYANSIWQKGNFSARELVNHVAEMLGDRVVQPRKHSMISRPVSDRLLKTFGQGRRPRILVIDDYVADARLLRRLFEINHRFEVVEAHSGAEALEAIEESIPDLIILDLILPDISGEQLLEMLRQRAPTRDVPVVIVSAKEIDPGLRARLAVHANSVWSKATLDRSSLLAHVETILPE